jgi:hypothetical protein
MIYITPSIYQIYQIEYKWLFPNNFWVWSQKISINEHHEVRKEIPDQAIKWKWNRFQENYWEQESWCGE